MPKVTIPRPYQFFMLALCVYALLALAADVLIPLDPESRRILSWTDTAICIIFFGDFILSLVRSENRMKYLVTWGWIDLLSSIPMVDTLRWGRAARVLRILRVLRGVRSARVLTEFLLARRAESTSLAVSLLVILFLTFSSIAILQFEDADQGANITTARDAIWWSFVTITTVGYGDRYPVSTEGRVIAGALMVLGVGLFGTFTAVVASWFVRSDQDEGGGEIEALRVEVVRLREMLDRGAGHAAN